MNVIYTTECAVINRANRVLLHALFGPSSHASTPSNLMEQLWLGEREGERDQQSMKCMCQERMAGNYEESDLFDILTQSLFNPGQHGNLPEADWLLPQVPPPTEFNEQVREQSDGVPRVVEDTSARFGSPVSSSKISAIQNLAVPTNTPTGQWMYGTSGLSTQASNSV